MNDVGDGLKAKNANWAFGGEVAQNFDGHVSKSVPYYSAGHDLVVSLSDYFVQDDSICYELGCSTGALSIKLAEHNAHNKNARFIGIDIEEDMILQALARNNKHNCSNVEFIVDDILQFDFDHSDFIVAYYTIQFVKPSARQQFIDKIYSSMKWGGAFLLFEKVRANDARFQDIMTNLYNDYKLEQGYTPEEIMSKTRSLKGILEPFSTQGNIDLLKRAGFVDIISVMKYICFEGYLAIK